MDKLLDGVLKVSAAALLAMSAIAFVAIISAFPIKWCWNATMPGIFHLKEIGVLEAFCLTWLAGAFFKASATAKS